MHALFILQSFAHLSCLGTWQVHACGLAQLTSLGGNLCKHRRQRDVHRVSATPCRGACLRCLRRPPADTRSDTPRHVRPCACAPDAAARTCAHMPWWLCLSSSSLCVMTGLNAEGPRNHSVLACHCHVLLILSSAICRPAMLHVLQHDLNPSLPYLGHRLGIGQDQQ